MSLTGYDFGDYLIRDMVRRNHEPCEPQPTEGPTNPDTAAAES